MLQAHAPGSVREPGVSLHLVPPRRALVGRARALAELERGLLRAGGGLGELHLLIGEPGSGKTALADAVAASAEARGFRVRWARAFEDGPAPAAWVWRQILKGAQPWLRAGSASPFSPCFRTARNLRACLADGEEAQLLVLEDLHAADPASLALLRLLARELRGLRVMMLATCRAFASSEAGAALGAIAREARVSTLPRFGFAEVGELLRAAHPGASDELVAELLDWTGGNPRLVEQLVAAGGRPGAIPLGAAAALTGVLDQLPPGGLAILEAAAVLGPADVCTLAAVAEVDAREVERAAEAALALGLLVAGEGARYGFAHGLARVVLDRGLEVARRRVLHARAARVRAAEVPVDLVVVARHWLSAGPSARGEAARAVVAAVLAPGVWHEPPANARAGERASMAKTRHRLSAPAAIANAHPDERGSSAEAHGLAIAGLTAMVAAAPDQRAALLAEARQSLAGAEDDGLRAELALAEATLGFRSGDRRRGRSAYLVALSFARANPDATLLARVASADGIDFTALSCEVDEAALLEEARARLPAGDSALAARVLARLGAARHLRTSDRAPFTLAHEAIAMARRLNDGPTLAAVMHEGLSAMMDFVHPAEGPPIDAELERLAANLGDRSRALRATARLCFDHLGRGELRRADGRIAAYERLAAEVPGAAAWRGPLFRAMRALMEGRFAEAEALAETARLRAEADDDATAAPCLLGHRLATMRAREDYAELPAVLSELRVVWSAFPHFEDWLFVLQAIMHLRQGHRGAAQAALARADVGALLPAAEAGLLGQLAEACAGAGDPALAARVYARLESYGGWLMNCGLLGMYCEGPFDRQLGLLAAALGRPLEARQRLESAIARNRALGLLPHLARTLFELAELLAREARGELGVRTLLAEAADLARRLHQPALLSQIEALTSRLAGGCRPAPASTDFDLVREGDYWTVRSPEGVARLKHSRGLETLARLCSQPDQDLHATELATPSPGTPDRGDAGELLDATARAAYRARLADLDDTVAEATARGDLPRAQRAQQEIDFLAAELTRAVGLGGRPRRATAAAERARVTVQKRLRHAIRAITTAAPALGRYLSLTVQTGTYCSYRPLAR